MNVGIVGLGIVGSAVKHGFEKLGHRVFGHDIKDGTSIEDVLETEIIYLCLPTPQAADGHCDISILDATIAELAGKHSYPGVIAIKSTVVPGTTKMFQEKFGNEKICHVPEFLRERAAIVDFTDNHDLCIIGTDLDQVYDVVKESHGYYPKQFTKLPPTEAEFCKYFNNVYNAVLITFANGMYELCQKTGADYSKVKNAIVQREHIYNKYLDCNENLRGFGGMCLPKDTSALAAMAKDLGLNIGLFETVINDNKNYKTTVFEGMRK